MNIEKLLVLHASPTLANLKAASLICLRGFAEEAGEMDEEILKEKGVSFRIFKTRKNCSLLFIYREKKLRESLASPIAVKLLEENGYDTSSLPLMLDRLEQKFLTEDCPHEVGLFLDYPPTDVCLFIKNKGRNAISSGLWKIYTDKDEAERISAKWTKCRKKYIECFQNGTELSRLCVTA